MAFPAYSTSAAEAYNSENSGDKVADNTDWLQCSSFVPPANVSVENEKEKEKSHLRRKKKHRVKKKEISSQSYYEIDLKPVPQIKCTLPSSSPGTSKLNVSTKVKKKKRKKLDKTSSRYFAGECGPTVADLKLDPDEYFRQTRDFNILLRDNPSDVDAWCKYIQLQDNGEGTARGIASKKLSIVEKALENNLTSDVLLNMKLNLMEQLFPYDRVVNEARILASKHSSSKVGWRWLISSTQFSLTRLTAPGLINHFSSMLEDITKRGGQPKFVLDVLLEVGLFLRHAGLWELLWTLVEQYLEICFTSISSGAFKVDVELPEQEIEKLEDSIMTSGLPLHALWIRTEYLRSCVHFLPTLKETGDHQRLVLPEDVAPLLYPITPDLSTRLSSVALILLKVPPLPCTNAFVSFLGLDKDAWHLESSEILLTALQHSVVQHDVTYLSDLKELLVPPQYVKDNLGQDAFTDAVGKMFDRVAHHCSADRIHFLVWQIRWWRFCVQTRALSGPNAKPFLTKAKAILKKERTALPIYTEYALLEEAAGNVAGSLKVLQTTIQLQEPGLLASSIEKQHIFALYRAYIEVLLRSQINDFKEKMLSLLVAMAYGEKLEKINGVTPDLAQKALQRFEHVSAELLADLDAEDSASLEDVIHGSADLHWLSCHGWLHFLQHGRLPHFLSGDINFTKAPILSENLVMLKIDILSQMRLCGSLAFDHKNFVNCVSDACTRFPNNTFFLHSLSSTKLDGIRWSKISTSLVASGSPIAAMFYILISKQRLFSSNSSQTGGTTKMYSILKKCAESKNLERCPMLRRLILQYVSCALEENVVEQEYHKAVEKCPWVKILYYEAANQVPKLLAEIQDLLTEKELRIHVTPEELEILRESAPPEDENTRVEVSVTDEKSEGCDIATKMSLKSEIDVKTTPLTDHGGGILLESIPLPPSPSSDVSESDSSSRDGDSDRSEQGSNKNYPNFEDQPLVDLSSWDEDRLSRARNTFVAKRAAKRSVGEIDQEIDEVQTGEVSQSTEMTKLEETEVAKLVGDSCQDETLVSDYVSVEWNKEKLAAMREKWESKRKKI